MISCGFGGGCASGWGLLGAIGGGIGDGGLFAGGGPGIGGGAGTGNGPPVVGFNCGGGIGAECCGGSGGGCCCCGGGCPPPGRFAPGSAIDGIGAAIFSAESPLEPLYDDCETNIIGLTTRSSGVFCGDTSDVLKPLFPWTN